MKLKKDEIFERGDHVILLDSAGIHILEKYKTYKVFETRMGYRGDQMLAFEDVYDDEDGRIHHYFNSKRFTKDIKPIRKKKLQKIFDSQYQENTLEIEIEKNINNEANQRVNYWRYLKDLAKNRLRLFRSGNNKPTLQ